MPPRKPWGRWRRSARRFEDFGHYPRPPSQHVSQIVWQREHWSLARISNNSPSQTGQAGRRESGAGAVVSLFRSMIDLSVASLPRGLCQPPIGPSITRNAMDGGNFRTSPGFATQDQMDDPRESVLKRLPKALAKREQAIFELGAFVPSLPAIWFIYSTNSTDQEIIGEGETEELAWANAAANLEDRVD